MMRYTRVIIIFFLVVLINIGVIYATGKENTLEDFEHGLKSSEVDIMGFRNKDIMRAVIAQEGTEGTHKSALFNLFPSRNKSSNVEIDFFYQGSVRRMYLATKNSKYNEDGPNALSFWVKLKPNSFLIRNNKVANTFGLWTYHWKFGDEFVGGNSNNELATDSMMHGYSNFKFNEKAAGRWVNVVLAPSAFQQSRYYYHFYAARGTTDDLQFFPSLRQLQFHFFHEIKKEEEIQIDQMKLIYLEPTANFEKDFFKTKVSKETGNVDVPVVIKNPTNKDRKYRVFISSFLGVYRDVLYGAHILTDSFEPPRMMQSAVGGDGGIGVVGLIDKDGDSIIEKQKEIFIPSGGTWNGKFIHYIKPEMLGPTRVVSSNGYKFFARRDTLTTSVIVWDPYDESIGKMDYIEVLPSNADDGNHKAPPGFPPQKIPPEGWRSENIPINQVGGYFVSIIQLTD